MGDYVTDPSNNFHTGGALIDPQRLGCTGVYRALGAGTLRIGDLDYAVRFYLGRQG